MRRAVGAVGAIVLSAALVLPGCDEASREPAVPPDQALGQDVASAPSADVQAASAAAPLTSGVPQPTDASRIRQQSEPVPDVLPMPTGAAAELAIDDPLAPSALIQRRFYCFHQNPIADDVPKLVAAINARGFLNQGWVKAQVSGFVSVNVERHPTLMRAWLEAVARDMPIEQCALVWRGIWNADVEGTEDVLRAYAEDVEDNIARNAIRDIVRQPKWLMLEGEAASQLDAHRQIGALVGSGDDAHLARVMMTIEKGMPSRAATESMEEVNAASNAKASLGAVCAMNDVIYDKVKALRARAEGEMAMEIEAIIQLAEANRAAAAAAAGPQ